MFEVYKGQIAEPKNTDRAKLNYAFKIMNIGDSIKAPISIQGSTGAYSKQNSIKVKTKKIDDQTIEITRIG